jgi:anthraniloyl-CoA monooxygenase
VRIHIVGGGPAGLYFALLMRQADPSHEVTVVERNPAGATFGWGVVFSEETLGALRDADAETHAAITDSFARWDAIDIHRGAETVRSRGHAFTGIARRRLLEILQRRCLEVGATLQFEREVADPFDVDADLVIAADGVNSFTRRTRPSAFGVREHVHGTKFVWLGVDRAFTAFTFVFRDTPYGMFQVHAYPFDAGASTFIVECHESTWRAAGLEAATEDDTIAFCEQLFAEELEGRRLLSNRSLWTSFVTVRCDSWHDGRVALMGDAAHTAHFTIGSGTKLAMEDAIALAQALRRHKDVPAALVDYEMERQPVVERFQQAATESASYFEHVARYARLPALLFAFNLLTRSGRIGHANLSLRDPDLVRRVDAWFAEGADAVHRRLGPTPSFAPLALRGMTLANRVVLSPVGLDGADGGTPGDAHLAALTGAARAGAGLVLTDLAAISADGRVTPGSAGMYAPEHTAAWSKVTWFVHELAGAKIAMQIGHAGRRGSTRPRRFGVDRPLRAGNWPLVAASPMPYTPRSQTPFEVGEAEMREIVERFARAAAMAAEAGFDALEVNMAHGYLLGGFLSPLANVRTDAYGGSPPARRAFPLAVVDAVRSAWPRERPLAVSLSATDWASGGLGVDEAVETARLLGEHGCDLVRVLAGQTTARGRPEYGRMFLVPFADRIRNEAGVPVAVGGGLTTLDAVDTVLAAGRADLCLMDLA